ERFFQRLNTELSGSYLLSFEALPSELDGKPHRIEVRVSRRPQPVVRARMAFVMTPLSSDNRAASARVPAGDKPPPVESKSGETVGTGTTPATDLGLSVLLQRASAYVGEFERPVSNLVVEERYVQVVKLWRGDPPSAGQAPELV